MLTKQRHALILSRLAMHGEVIAKSLAQELGLSEDSIRRDLRELAQQGKLQRVHGGALPSANAVGNLNVRETLDTDEKILLGKHAASLIQNGQVVIVDGGTSTLMMVKQLSKTLSATIVTHSPTIASALQNHERIEVIMLGGRLFKHSMVNMGANTIEAARKINADLYFIGATGVHAKAGLTTGDFEEAQIKRVLHEQAAETCLMASAEKIGAASAFEITAAKNISQILYSSQYLNTAQAQAIQAIAELGINIQDCTT
jgi:DeoR/GlpR family transcriptional regulator of sugar metabolism